MFILGREIVPRVISVSSVEFGDSGDFRLIAQLAESATRYTGFRHEQRGDTLALTLFGSVVCGAVGEIELVVKGLAPPTIGRVVICGRGESHTVWEGSGA